MRFATALLTAVVFLCTAAAFATTPTTGSHQVVEPKPMTMGGSDPIYINVGGDNVGTATNIPALPYSDGGSTSGFVNDYTPPCAFSSAADVVYRFAPTADVQATVSLCGSTYDTVLYIFQNTVGNVIACIDDFCGLQSELRCVPMTAGNVYYFIIDGYSSAAGTYTLNVTECVPCIIECPPGGVAEGEPDCADNYDDFYNAGCNTPPGTPPQFTQLLCPPAGGNITVCGRYGVFNHYSGFTYRDTDWYQITLPVATTVSWCVAGEYDTLLGIIDGRNGCPASSFYSYTTTAPCTPACVTETLPAGTWWFFVATASWDSSFLCGGDYVATLSGFDCPPIAVEPTSWGSVKTLYR